MSLFKYTMLSMLFGSMIAALALNANAQSRLWVSDTRTDGNIGGRDGADALCNLDKHNPKIEGMKTIALIAFNAHDNLKTMPYKRRVPKHNTVTRDDGTTLIANSYLDILNVESKPLINSVTPSHHNIEVWTGSGIAGEAYEDTNCKGFTSSDKNISGMKGAAHAPNSNFLYDGHISDCNTQAPIYCLSFLPNPR